MIYKFNINIITTTLSKPLTYYILRLAIPIYTSFYKFVLCKQRISNDDNSTIIKKFKNQEKNIIIILLGVKS